MDSARIPRFLLIVLVFFFCSVRSFAEGTDRAILYIVCDTPGSHVDEMARRQQLALKDILNTPVVLTYRPGGNSSEGWAEIAHAPPDGYHISTMILPRLILNPLVRKNVGYDPEQLLPLVIYQSIPIGLAVQDDYPAQSLEDFIAFAKQNPRKIKVGVDAQYSPQYLALYQFQKLAGIELTTVVFAGPAKQMAGFRSKHVETVMARSTDLLTHGKGLTILALGTRERMELFPSVPTFAEMGIDIDPRIDLGVCIRKGTPEDKIQVLERAFMSIAQQDTADTAMKSNGFIPLAVGNAQALLQIEQMKRDYQRMVSEIDTLKGHVYEIRQ